LSSSSSEFKAFLNKKISKFVRNFACLFVGLYEDGREKKTEVKKCMCERLKEQEREIYLPEN